MGYARAANKDGDALARALGANVSYGFTMEKRLR
jgi:hypothetical protein